MAQDPDRLRGTAGQRLAPKARTKQTGAGSLRFAIGKPGDAFMVSVKGADFYLNTGDNTVVAASTNTPFKEGAYGPFQLDDGCTDVAVIGATSIEADAWKCSAS